LQKNQSKTAKKEIVAEPEEWDFRSVPLSIHRMASFYGHARFNEGIIKRVGEWHKNLIRVPKSAPDFEKWNGITVGQALAAVNFPRRPQQVTSAIFASMPEWLSKPPFKQLHDISYQFPMPFVHLQKSEMELLESEAEEEAEDIEHVYNPEIGKKLRETTDPKERSQLMKRLHDNKTKKRFCVLESPVEYSPSELQMLARDGIYYPHCMIDISRGKEPVWKQFRKWLGELPDFIPQGRAASEPSHELRELAAFTLHQRGFGQQKAQRYIKEYLEKHPGSDKYSVLPTYKTSGAWSKAVNNCKHRIKSLYPLPYREFELPLSER
jgi:hypothetical protein